MTDSPRPLAPGSGEAVAPPRPFEDVASILDHLAPRARSDEERAYLRVHAPRYRFLLQTVSALLERRRPELRGTEPLQVLDIGPHFLTELLAAATPARVNTAGVRFAFPGGHPRIGAHLDIDLNEAHRQSGWRGFLKHDVVTACEILEHLHASPRMVLGCISRWVKDGGFLVVQTPNAVALERRLGLLTGRNPFDMIAEGDNPAHFREYTAEEVAMLAQPWGLELESISYTNYFDLPERSGPRKLLYDLVTRAWPRLRDGMTLVFRKLPDVPDPGAPSRCIKGFVELIDVAPGLLTVAGWAVDTARHGPVRVIELVLDGQTFNGVAPVHARPDVVGVLGGDKAYSRSGFHLTCVPPAGFDVSRLVLRARDLYGDSMELPVLARET